MPMCVFVLSSHARTCNVDLHLDMRARLKQACNKRIMPMHVSTHAWSSRRATNASCMPMRMRMCVSMHAWSNKHAHAHAHAHVCPCMLQQACNKRITHHAHVRAIKTRMRHARKHTSKFRHAMRTHACKPIPTKMLLLSCFLHTPQRKTAQNPGPPSYSYASKTYTPRTVNQCFTQTSFWWVDF